MMASSDSCFRETLRVQSNPGSGVDANSSTPGSELYLSPKNAKKPREEEPPGLVQLAILCQAFVLILKRSKVLSSGELEMWKLV